MVARSLFCLELYFIGGIFIKENKTYDYRNLREEKSLTEVCAKSTEHANALP